MSDQNPQPDLEEAPGWAVIDPDGNVVASGPMTEGQPVDMPVEQSEEEEAR